MVLLKFPMQPLKSTPKRDNILNVLCFFPIVTCFSGVNRTCGCHTRFILQHLRLLQATSFAEERCWELTYPKGQQQTPQCRPLHFRTSYLHGFAPWLVTKWGVRKCNSAGPEDPNLGPNLAEPTCWSKDLINKSGCAPQCWPSTVNMVPFFSAPLVVYHSDTNTLTPTSLATWFSVYLLLYILYTTKSLYVMYP